MGQICGKIGHGGKFWGWAISLDNLGVGMVDF